VQVWQTSTLRRLKLGEEKKKKRKKEEQTTGGKYNGLPYSIRRPYKKSSPVIKFTVLPF